MRRLIAIFLLILTPALAGAAGGGDQWSPAREARYLDLLEELRCMVCQNETLKASQADLAKDLRQQVRAMIARGASDEDVKQYLVARYGEYILYRPPFELNTWLLWLGPFVLLLGGAGVVAVVIRRSRRSAPESAYSAEAVARARRVLEERDP